MVDVDDAMMKTASEIVAKRFVFSFVIGNAKMEKGRSEKLAVNAVTDSAKSKMVLASTASVEFFAIYNSVTGDSGC